VTATQLAVRARLERDDDLAAPSFDPPEAESPPDTAESGTRSSPEGSRRRSRRSSRSDSKSSSKRTDTLSATLPPRSVTTLGSSSE